jgi:hypothetical protein
VFFGPVASMLGADETDRIQGRMGRGRSPVKMIFVARSNLDLILSRS